MIGPNSPFPHFQFTPNPLELRPNISLFLSCFSGQMSKILLDNIPTLVYNIDSSDAVDEVIFNLEGVLRWWI